MLGIKVHDPLEEVALLCLVQRPQLTQDGGVYERWVDVPVRIGRSFVNGRLRRTAVIRPSNPAARCLTSRYATHQAWSELRDREGLMDDRIHAGKPPLLGRRADHVRGQGD